MANNILFVDDEEQLLKSYQRSLRKEYAIDMASSASQAIELIKHNPDYQVVVSDFQMPNMNGVEFLNQVKSLIPDASRVMLTGEADLKSTMNAINESEIFRFLLKPCEPEQLLAILQQAVTHYNLVIAEKVLLEKTLNGTVNMMSDMLSLIRPDVFAIALLQKDRIESLCNSLSIIDKTWQYGLAIIFTYFSYMLLHSDAIKNINTDEALQQEFNEANQTVLSWINDIPRLEPVYKILQLYFTDLQDHKLAWHEIKLEQAKDNSLVGACLVNFLVKYENKIIQGEKQYAAIEQLEKVFDKKLIDAFLKLDKSQKQAVLKKCAIDELTENMIFAEDVTNTAGALLVKAGQSVTPRITAGLKLAVKNHSLVEPIAVKIVK